MNYTFQDRLVKEMREANIYDIKSANKFLKEVFLPQFNAKFTIGARESSDLHISLSANERNYLNQIFSKQSKRKLKNDFTIAFNNNNYQLYRNKYLKSVTLHKWDIITVEEHLDWNIYFSKKWTYFIPKKLNEKRKSKYILPLAPINNTNFKEMKDEIDKLKEINKIKKKNKKSYFEIHWKPHPWMKWVKF